MRSRLVLCGLLLALLPGISIAQAPIQHPDQVPQAHLTQSTGLDPVRRDPVRLDKTPLILNDSRTNVGKDFYELFYQHWNLTTPTDTVQLQCLALLFAAHDLTITIQEPPSDRGGPVPFLNSTSTQIQIGINGQPIWRQFVRGQSEELEMAVLDAVEVVRQKLNDAAIELLIDSAKQQSTDVH